MYVQMHTNILKVPLQLYKHVALLPCTAAHKVNTANTKLERIIDHFTDKFQLGITSLTHVQYVSNHSLLKVTEQHTACPKLCL